MFGFRTVAASTSCSPLYSFVAALVEDGSECIGDLALTISDIHKGGNAVFRSLRHGDSLYLMSAHQQKMSGSKSELRFCSVAAAVSGWDACGWPRWNHSYFRRVLKSY